jgi:hypothetical protein
MINFTISFNISHVLCPFSKSFVLKELVKMLVLIPLRIVLEQDRGDRRDIRESTTEKGLVGSGTDECSQRDDRRKE